MEKKFFYFFVFLLFILFSNCEEVNKEEEEESELDDEQYFKNFLKEYLAKRNLLDSDSPVERDELRKIFLDVITEEDESTEYVETLFGNLADYFMDTYYKDRPIIRGKEIYDLIDMNIVSSKLEEMVGNLQNLLEEEEEGDFDIRDAAPNPDM